MRTPRTTQQHHSSREHEQGKALVSRTHQTAQMNRHTTHWSAHRKRNAWLLLLVLLLGVGTIAALASAAAPRTGQTGGTQPETASTPAATTSSPAGTPVPTARMVTRIARPHLYPFPQANAGLMQPAVDARGNLWVGEMSANRLARLDAQTGVVTSWQTPNGQNGIMTNVLDTRGNVWFVEQGANYIGRFDPVQQTFRIFPLGSVGGRPMGPQALQFDARGLLWFTAAAGGRIGRLDPTTGVIRTWPVPAPRPGVLPSPYSLTVLPGGQIWFGDIIGGAVGHLDATTGRVTLYHLADPQETVFSMAHDAKGRIWFTEVVPARLGMIESTTGSVKEWAVPAVSDQTAALYGIVVAPGGDVWFAANGLSALVRYAPGTETFTSYQLSLSAGLYGLALAPSGTLWFTASSPSTNYAGEMTP